MRGILPVYFASVWPQYLQEQGKWGKTYTNLGFQRVSGQDVRNPQFYQDSYFRLIWGFLWNVIEPDSAGLNSLHNVGQEMLSSILKYEQKLAESRRAASKKYLAVLGC